MIRKGIKDMYAKINVFDPKSGYFAVENSNTELTEEDIAEAARKIVNGFFEEYQKHPNSSPHATLSIEGQYIPELIDLILVYVHGLNMKTIDTNIEINRGWYNDNKFEDEEFEQSADFDIYQDIKDKFWLEISFPLNRKNIITTGGIEDFLTSYDKSDLGEGDKDKYIMFNTSDIAVSEITKRVDKVIKYEEISFFKDDAIWDVMIKNPVWKENSK